MRYIIYVEDRELTAKALKEAILKARTIYNVTGVKPLILDTFCNEYVGY